MFYLRSNRKAALQPPGVYRDINPEWLTRGLSALIHYGPGLSYPVDVRNGVNLTSDNVGSPWWKTTQWGRARIYVGSGHSVFPNTGGRYNLTSTSGGAIVCLFTLNSLSNYTGLVGCQEGPISWGWELRGGSGSANGEINLGRMTAGNTYEFYKSPAGDILLTGGAKNFVGVTWYTDQVEQQADFFHNGTWYTGTHVGGTGGGTIGPARDSAGGHLYIGRRIDGVTYMDGEISLVALFNQRGLTAGELGELYDNPYGLFKAPSANRTYFIPDPPVPAATTLHVMTTGLRW